MFLIQDKTAFDCTHAFLEAVDGHDAPAPPSTR
jgi:hypothetical protein